MSKYNFLIPAFLILPFVAFSQNVGIGTLPTTRAILEVQGASGAGRTSGAFGGPAGISLQKKLPAIGFNQYDDDSLAGNGRYLGNGYAAVLSYRYNDPGLSTGLDLHIYPSGSADGLVPAGIRAFRLSNNGRFSIMNDGNAVLDVARGTGFNGTAMFQGTEHQSHINYSTAENTYIRSGRSGNVYINDILNGKVIFGDGGTRVGINTQVPNYTLEMRQVAGTGIRMANAPYLPQTWEWRVVGNPATYNLYHSGNLRNYFRPSDGALNLISDGRLKQNIRPLEDVLTKILKLRPVTYEMRNNNPTHIRTMGFIAQEVAPYFPMLAYSGGTNNSEMMSLNYGAFGVVAIKGIQEEEKHIVGLEQKMKDAENRMQALEKKLAAKSK